MTIHPNPLFRGYIHTKVMSDRWWSLQKMGCPFPARHTITDISSNPDVNSWVVWRIRDAISASVKLFELGVRMPGGLFFGVWYTRVIEFQRFSYAKPSDFRHNFRPTQSDETETECDTSKMHRKTRNSYADCRLPSRSLPKISGNAEKQWNVESHQYVCKSVYWFYWVINL